VPDIAANVSPIAGANPINEAQAPQTHTKARFLMKHGICIQLTSPFATPRFVRSIGIEAESRGFESIWIGEHVVTFETEADKSAYPYTHDGKRPSLRPGDGGFYEPLMTLAFLAAATSTIRLGTGILILAQRNPVVTAFQLAAADRLSDGRIDVGIGLNWSAEEYRALSVPFEQRGRRTDEYTSVMRTLWCDEVSAYTGDFYDLPPCRMYPKPIQKPHPPIHISGNSDPALRRVARIGDGWYGLGLGAAQVTERLTTLDRFLQATDRLRGDIETTMARRPDGPLQTPDPAGCYAEAGLGRLVDIISPTDDDELKRSLDRLMWPSGIAPS
jgi:probable F420-dependent oxidoreductase